MKMYAPWTPVGATNLNEWQRCDWVHPFTCGSGNRLDDDHRRAARVMNHGDPGTLIATRLGWFCPGCGYKQEWAHDFMLRGPPPKPVIG